MPTVSPPSSLKNYLNKPSANTSLKFAFTLSSNVTTLSLASSNFSSKNSNSDLYKIQIPSDLRPAIVSTISGIIMSTSKQPIEANILWEDLSNGQKIGSAKSNPVDGSYFIALPTGKNYGYFVDHPDYFPTSNNVDLRLVSSMQEIILDISPVSYDEMIKQNRYGDMSSKRGKIQKIRPI